MVDADSPAWSPNEGYTRLCLQNGVGKTFILAHREDTTRLERALDQEGMPYEVLRQVHQDEFRHYSRSYLALLNHRQAWAAAAEAMTFTLVVEADFVPIKGFGQLPMPFCSTQSDVGMAWLYTCAPQVYSVSQEGYAQGFSTAMVAYLIAPAAAAALLDMAEAIAHDPGPEAYAPWDSSIEGFLRTRGFKNFVPFRNYGEHGGRPNPEHRQYGLSRTHRADVLYGALAFMPLYALATDPSPDQASSATVGERIRYGWVRSQARLKGIARLAMGKFLRWPVVRRSNVPHRLLSFAIRRQLSLRL